MMLLFKCSIVIVLMALVNGAAIHKRLALREILTSIENAHRKMDLCGNYVPNIFNDKGAPSFCQVAKVLSEVVCPSKKMYIKQIKSNLDHLSIHDCTVEDGIPRIPLNDFLYLLKKFVSHKMHTQSR